MFSLIGSIVLFFPSGLITQDDTRPVFGDPISMVEGKNGLVVEARALEVIDGGAKLPAGFFRYIVTHRKKNETALNDFYSDFHIVHIVKGRHPNLSIAAFTLESEEVFQLEYKAGANQTYRQFGIVKNGLLMFFETAIASNMSRFEISTTGEIKAYNSLYSVRSPDPRVCVTSYEFVDLDTLELSDRSAGCPVPQH